MSKRTRSYRAWLEVRNDDGPTGYEATRAIVASEDLQRRCIEKQELRHAAKILTAPERSNVLPFSPVIH